MAARKTRRRHRGKLEEWLTSLAIPLFLTVMRLLPVRWLYAIGRGMGHITYLCLRRYRKIAMANLWLVFGTTKSANERRAIYRRFLTRTMVNALQIAKFALLPPAVMAQRIDIVGREHLDLALNQGTGVIAITVHLDNFPLIGPRLALEGYPFLFILKYPKNRSLAHLFDRYADHVGISFIDGWQKRQATHESIATLRRNRILCLLLDQNPPYADIKVDFFGYPVPVFKGPVPLAERTGAVIVPMFMVGDGPHRHRLIIEKPFTLEMTGEPERDVHDNMARLIALTEDYVRRYPDQWWWWHRRWKYHIDYKRL
jgi:KDO2-lipid IV(A) lauroyltransferase